MNKKVKEIPSFDLPRAKLIDKGVKVLSNIELLCVILGSGIQNKNVFEVSKDILQIANNNFQNLTLDNLLQLEGVGKAKACQILAAIEFSRRFLIREGIHVKKKKDVLNLVGDLHTKKQEYFLTLTLDGANNLIQKRIVFIGTLNKSIVHPREIFADAISDRAAGIILVHNHPSGNSEPTGEDLLLTNRLVEAGKIVGIEIIDHVIISNKNSYSFRDYRIL
jgi:DNA repair protein RadC